MADENMSFEDNLKELEEIVIPKNVEIIRDTAFLGCSNLKEVRLLCKNAQIERRTFDKQTLDSVNNIVVSYL